MKKESDSKSQLEQILEKISENPEEFYIKIAKSLSAEERNTFRELVEGKSCKNCSNGCCSVPNAEKVSDDTACSSWINDGMTGKRFIKSWSKLNKK